MALSQLITTTDIANSNVGINNSVTDGTTNAIALGNGQNVGIGIAAPLTGLHLGNVGSTIPAIYLGDASNATLPTIEVNDGVFSVMLGVPTFTNTTGTKTLFSLNSEAVGTATLVAGTVTITSTIVSANSTILITRTSTTGGVTTVGTLNVGTIVPGVSFDVNSTVITDVGNLNYMIINA